MDLFNINEDISLAETISSSFYTSEEYFQLSKGKIFLKTWLYVSDTDIAKVPGQVAPFTILENFLDEPLILTRDKNDRLHCLSNVCTHRGNILVEGSCIEKNITCRYHGKRFDLDGKFLSMPEFNEVKNFPSVADNLPKIPFNTWEKFLFVSLNPVSPIQDFVGDMCSRMSWLPLNEFIFDSARSKDYLLKAHWALYCENYLEGFHIPYVHADLNAALDYSSYRTELFKFSSLQVGIGKSGEDCFEIPKESPDFGQKISAYYFWIFPNFMFNFYPWGLSINVVKPLKTDLSKVSFLTYVWDESKLSKGAGAGLDKVEREDETIVENVQKGIKSRLYERGRYSVKRETGTHHFHRLIAEFMR